MAKRNFLVEGGSGCGKSSVYRELRRRGIPAIDGDNELAYKGDPHTGEPVENPTFWHHIWDVDRVLALAADRSADVLFFCGGSRNVHRFITVFDEVFVLDIDAATLARRLEARDPDDWGGNDAQKAFILKLHETRGAVPAGTIIDTDRPIEAVVDAILARVAVAGVAI